LANESGGGASMALAWLNVQLLMSGVALLAARDNSAVISAQWRGVAAWRRSIGIW